jgi:hypothetical protein
MPLLFSSSLRSVIFIGILDFQDFLDRVEPFDLFECFSFRTDSPFLDELIPVDYQRHH